MFKQPEANPQESNNNYFTDARRKAAGLMLGLSMAAGLAGTANARSAEAESNRPAATKSAEANPSIALRRKVLEQIADGKLRVKVLDLAFTFSTDTKTPSFFFAPKGDKPDTTKFIEGPGNYEGNRFHWVAKDPIYIQNYNHKNWLVFLDQNALNAETDPGLGHAGDFAASVFMDPDHMPRDTKVYTSKRLGITGHLEPAHIDSTGSIATDRITNGAETMLSFHTKAEVSGVVNGMGMTQTHSKYIPGH